MLVAAIERDSQNETDEEAIRSSRGDNARLDVSSPK